MEINSFALHQLKPVLQFFIVIRRLWMDKTISEVKQSLSVFTFLEDAELNTKQEVMRCIDSMNEDYTVREMISILYTSLNKLRIIIKNPNF